MLHEPRTLHQLVRAVEHRAGVGGDIGLALRAVDDDGLDLLEILDGQLHDRREARAAEADHAAGADGVEKVLHRLELRGLELGIGFLLAVGGDDDGLHEPSAGADLLTDLLDRARDARVHGRGHEAAGFADQLADPDAVAGLDDRDGGRADVHGHRDLHRLGNGQAQRSQLRGVFAVRHVYAVDV